MLRAGMRGGRRGGGGRGAVGVISSSAVVSVCASTIWSEPVHVHVPLSEGPSSLISQLPAHDPGSCPVGGPAVGVGGVSAHTYPAQTVVVELHCSTIIHLIT